MSKLTASERNGLGDEMFALPGRRYPVEDRSHAANAKARATQQEHRGNLSPVEAAMVRRKANKVLGK